MITGTQVIDQVLTELDEDPVSPIFWTRGEILDHVNDGMTQLNLIAAKQKSERPFTPSETNFQTVPSGVISILQISYQNESLRKKSLESIDREDSQWMNRPGIPKSWGPVGSNIFFVDRVPKTVPKTVSNPGPAGRNRRASSVNVPILVMKPVPDGTIDKLDRRQSCFLYRGPIPAPQVPNPARARRNRRASSVNMPILVMKPVPDGSIDKLDRRQCAFLFTRSVSASQVPTTTQLTLLTLNEAALILDDSTPIDLDKEYVTALRDYAVHAARFKEGGAEFANTMQSYDDFQKQSGMVEDRSMADRYSTWTAEVNIDTGGDYSSIDRGS